MYPSRVIPSRTPTQYLVENPNQRGKISGCVPWRHLHSVYLSSERPQEDANAYLSWHPVSAAGPAHAYS